MKTTIIFAFPLIFLITYFLCSSIASPDNDHINFLKCFSSKFQNYSFISDLVYTPTNSSYSSVLLFPIWDLRFASEATPKPRVIITPEHESQIPPIIHCAKKTGLQIRTRSGGHDFEGLSFVSKVPFVIVDMIKLSDVKVDAEAKTAWVEAGALTGALYYRIAEKSPTLGFPAGIGTTLGAGGHFSGGGYGALFRKYGLAADHIIDARIVDAKGRILDRKSMGEDLFWAIRGGGGASFGVIVAWKVQLVDVPETITAFIVQRTTEQNATQLIHRWQYVAPRMDKDITLYINGVVTPSNQTQSNTTIVFSFFALYLGSVDGLLAVMEKSFPELGLTREDCNEMSWIQSVLYFEGRPSASPEALLNRTQLFKAYMKRHTDYVQIPIPEEGLEGLMKLYKEPEASRGSTLSFSPYGGVMDEIPESSIPFAHRAGNLYHIFYTVYWNQEDNQDPERFKNWVDKVNNYMTPYVSKSPRLAYLNYRDLDIGVNNVVGKTSYAQASVWGRRYFNSNFDSLVRVKTRVDRKNFFRYEQSIPPLY